MVITTRPLGFPWPTSDPFLFCAHHDDAYPAGDDNMGPRASLAGRMLGQDFERKDGWSMYHGLVVPGFPQHPHRGFETVTLARSGYIDHCDSMGAAARFGKGDVQWMTAGRGVVHSEMFPLLERDQPNPTELFQIWLNLPAADKMVEPHFAMLWNEAIPRVQLADGVDVTLVAGRLGDAVPPPPPPRSWAADEAHDVAIWTIVLQPGARCTLPAAARADSTRTLYFFRGDAVSIGERDFDAHAAIGVRADAELALHAGESTPVQLLLLQGQPIAEPVAHYGPFVMSTPAEIQQAIVDYRRSGYGGWPWDSDAPVHPREQGRFARHADGKVEQR